MPGDFVEDFFGADEDLWAHTDLVPGMVVIMTTNDTGPSKAWTSSELTPNEARELADWLNGAADVAEREAE